MISTLPTPTDNPSGTLIGFNNLLKSSSSSLTDVMLIPNTFERFRPTPILNEIKFQLASATDIDYIGFAAHNFGTHDGGLDIEFYYATTIGGSKILIDIIKPKNNSAFILTFDTVNAAEIILKFTPSTSGAEVGVLYSGEILQMPRNIYGGHSPIALSQKTEYQSAESESGQFLGETIIKKGLATNFSWQLLDDQFYRDEFQLFVDSATELPFFIKWRSDFYSDEVAYGKVRENITPVNMGGGIRLMSVSFNMKAHADL